MIEQPWAAVFLGLAGVVVLIAPAEFAIRWLWGLTHDRDPG